MPPFSPIPSVSQFVRPDKKNCHPHKILETNFKSVKSKLKLQLQSLVESKFHVINPSVIRELIRFFSGFESRFGISFLIMDVPLLFHLQLHDLAPIARQNFSVSSPDVDHPYVSSHWVNCLYASHFPVVSRQGLVHDYDEITHGYVRLWLSPFHPLMKQRQIFLSKTAV